MNQRVYVVIARNSGDLMLVVGVYSSYESALKARDQVTPPMYGTIYPKEITP